MGGFLHSRSGFHRTEPRIELFSYVALLDRCDAVLVVFKPWQRLLVLSFVGTFSLYVGWYASFYRQHAASPYPGFRQTYSLRSSPLRRSSLATERPQI